MALADDIREEVQGIFKNSWVKRDGQKVPDTDDIPLGNNTVVLDGTVLYADLAESTNMVNFQKDHFAAEVYKAYLAAVCKIIRDNSGEITAFDGDRVMAVYIGDYKNTNAAKTALNINWAVQKIVNDELQKQYPDNSFRAQQAVGIDTGKLWVAKTGVRGSNDLVWVGRAANYAAKLCSLRDGAKVSWITEPVFNVMKDSVKFSSDGQQMWEKRYWEKYSCSVYCSSWWRGL